MQLQQILSELKEMGFSQAKIGKAVGLDQSGISRIANGQDTSHSRAVRIIEFYNQQKTKTQ